MASSARIDELKKKFDENPRRYFAPLANEFRKAGDVEQAIMICEEFLPQQPGHMSGHIVYGQALFEAARFEEARTVFETALTLDPENLIALRHLGDIARGQGDVPSARRWYDRVLDADPRNEEIQVLIAGLEGESPSTTAQPADEPVSEPAPFAPQGGALAIERTPEPAFEPATPPAREQQAGEQRFAPPMPAAQSSHPEPIELELSDDAPAVRPRAEATPPQSPPVESGRAEGLESVEFTPPDGPLDRARDLGGTVEAGEFTAPADRIEPLAGLEETSIGAFERVPDGGPPLPMLDTSQPARPAAPPASTQGSETMVPTVEFSVPTAAELALAADQGEAVRAHPSSPRVAPAPERRLADAARSDVPPELPPAVIAAEAALMDLGEPLPPESSPAPTRVEPTSPAESTTASPAVRAVGPSTPVPAAPPPAAPFVTETMAELFLKQGFTAQALDVYQQLLAANPHEERFKARVAELQPAGPAAAGDSVRDFLSRLATLRPGARSAPQSPPAGDDFTSFAAVPAPGERTSPAQPVAELAPPPQVSPPATMRATPSAGMSTAIERAATTQRAGGSIDALFGNRAAGTSDDSAASALAQAFGGATEPPVITGRPARAAAGELSLDSVFRDGPARPPRSSQNFSFDQFFSPDSATADRAAPSSSPAPETSATTEPAERSADDIEQFNTWLQGLKPK